MNVGTRLHTFMSQYTYFFVQCLSAGPTGTGREKRKNWFLLVLAHCLSLIKLFSGRRNRGVSVLHCRVSGCGRRDGKFRDWATPAGNPAFFLTVFTAETRGKKRHFHILK